MTSKKKEEDQPIPTMTIAELMGVGYNNRSWRLVGIINEQARQDIASVLEQARVLQRDGAPPVFLHEEDIDGLFFGPGR